MNRFIIVDGLPYLYAKNKAYKVRWDNKGFTVGSEVELASEPTAIYTELSIKAQCANCLDSICEEEPEQEEENFESEDETEVLEQQEEEATVNFDEMKLEELKAFAKNNNIDLKGARTKAEIIEAIKND